MNHQTYDQVAGGLLKLARDIADSKRPGYTRGDEDVLANFKRSGRTAKVTPEQAWVVYFMKHIDAIVTHMAQPHLPISESMDGRFADAINYLQLGWGLLQERDQADLEAAAALLRAMPLPGGVKVFPQVLGGDECGCGECVKEG